MSRPSQQGFSQPLRVHTLAVPVRGHSCESMPMLAASAQPPASNTASPQQSGAGSDGGWHVATMCNGQGAAAPCPDPGLATRVCHYLGGRLGWHSS